MKRFVNNLKSLLRKTALTKQILIKVSLNQDCKIYSDDLCDSHIDLFLTSTHYLSEQ